MSVPLTIHLSDDEAETLRRIATEHKQAPEVLVLNNLRVSMRDYTHNRVIYGETSPQQGGRKAPRHIAVTEDLNR